MNLGEMLKALRADLNDIAAPYLWSDAELIRWTNEGETEACRRARLITDSTSSFTEVAFSIGDPSCKLDGRILFVKRVKLVGDSRPLAKTNVRELDCERPGWEEDAGWPSAWVADKQTGYLFLDRIPEEAITARLVVVRVPLSGMAKSQDEPEIPERFHENMLHWTKHRAYLKQDAETFDAEAAARSLALFEQEFGKRSTAQDEAFISANHDFGAHEGAY